MKKLKQIEAKLFADAVCGMSDLKEIVDEAPTSERAAFGACSGLVVAIATAGTVMAAPRFDEALGNMLQSLYGYILGISTGLAIVFMAINIVKYMVATDPQSALMAKKSAIRVGIAWIVLNSLGGIAALGTQLANNGKYTGKWHA